MLKKYTQKKGYKYEKSMKEDHILIYVPYTEHRKFTQYLKKYKIKFSLRFDWDYKTAIFFAEDL